jgi:O-succinylbenzoate synthase
MKCTTCQATMKKSTGDFDYTKLAGLAGKTVVLVDVEIYECARCGLHYVEIERLADLSRELDAARHLHVKQLRCSFDREWAIAFESKAKP